MLVLLFLSIVALASMVASFQASTVRRTSVRGQMGYQAVEICESAINEAAWQVNMDDVFPSADFGTTPHAQPSPLTTMSDMGAWFMSVANEDQATLNAKWGPAGYTFHFRLVALPAPKDKVFVSMEWPRAKRPGRSPGYQKEYTNADIPQTTAILPQGFKVGPVDMSVLSFRRDYVLGNKPQWEDWGVLHYIVKVTFDDGKSQLAREMQVDRMYSLYCHNLKTTGPEVYPDPNDPLQDDPAETDGSKLYVHLIQSRRNLKTVIRRS